MLSCRITAIFIKTYKYLWYCRRCVLILLIVQNIWIGTSITRALLIQICSSDNKGIQFFQQESGVNIFITSCMSHFLQGIHWSLSKRPQQAIKAFQDSRQDAHIRGWLWCTRLLKTRVSPTACLHEKEENRPEKEMITKHKCVMGVSPISSPAGLEML